MVVVKVAKVPGKKINVPQVLAQLCYYYPQYTLKQAEKLPAKDVMLLLKVARIEKATNWYNLTQIGSATLSKKGTGFKKLSKHFEGMMK